MDKPQLHKVEILILRTLRRSEAARFSALMQPTGLSSDSFKFYVRKLVKWDYIQKQDDGAYCLTPSGKELANNLDARKRTVQKQPKVSVIISASRQNSAGQTEYLFHQRKRQPYYDYWGELSGPVQWGEEPEETAKRELRKQTGLEADFRFALTYRARDYGQQSGQLLEDKLFLILEATNLDGKTGEMTNQWSGGRSQWMTLDELHKQPKVFPSTAKIIRAQQAGQNYLSEKLFYDETQEY